MATDGGLLKNPPWITALFSDTRFAWLWLIARVYIGWGWLHAGWGKMTGDGWMDGGGSLKGFWEYVVVVPESGRATISYDWYREFLEFLLETESYTWFGKLIAMGEFAAGLGLLLGAFTGIAAGAAAFMNLNFLLAGTASTNPVMGLIGLGIVIAWKTAGWWGFDRVLLPAVGAPWQKGRLFGGRAQAGPGESRFDSYEIERWVRVVAGVAIALFALISLDGLGQVLLLTAAGALVAATGLGWASITKRND